MNTKKLLAFSVIACSLLFLAGCGNKTADISTDEVTTVTEDVKTPELANKKPATKDQCIELMADAFMVAQFQAQNDNDSMVKWAQKANDLEVKYGNDNIEYEETCGKLLATDQSFMQLVQKYMKDLK